MRFGPLPVAEAEGTILAHSLQINGKRLRKGVLLGSDHLAQLQAAGVTEVTVARLDPGDWHEDRAALALAEALVPDPAAAGLTLSAPFTGRVNIHATGPGVVGLDAAQLAAVNAVDPMITLATVPPLQQVTARTMIATVKIISYGVAGAHVTQACTAARAGLRLIPTVHRTAALIVTDIAAGPGAQAAQKGQDAIAARVAALGMTLSAVTTVPHRTADLSAALAAARADIVLILTASATSDPRDVAPEALRRAGGQVERFGMPVDPGNLLFIGDLDGRPVIGLPGCARSPALNGADWVLARIACGLQLRSADIAAMGVGGLLKEIPTRPMPRAGRRSS